MEHNKIDDIIISNYTRKKIKEASNMINIEKRTGVNFNASRSN